MPNFNSLNEIDGLQFIPVMQNKRPIPKNWQNAAQKYDLSNVAGVGLVCGELSLNLEAIDIDLKYDLTGKLFERYKRAINDIDKDLLKKLVVQKTRSNGYHFIYRCTKIEGNLKLANRPITSEEKKYTYDETYKAKCQEGKSHEEADKIAQKASENDKVRVLLETRGLGGFIVCAPSEGYDFVFGDLQSISFITESERDTLFSIARQFNQVVEEPIEVDRKKAPKTAGLSSMDDYNQRGDVIGLLEEYGWKVVGKKGSKTLLLRPGQTTSASSGNFDHDKNWFSVFTTSTEFTPNKAYLPYSVYALLKCKNDFTETARQLYELGYGDRIEDKTKPKEPSKSTRQIYSRVEMDNDDFSFLATNKDYDPYLQQVLDGTLQRGLTTGSEYLDEHFLLKLGNLVMINGHDNVGKSVFIWWLLMLAAMYHGWRGVIFSSENSIGSFVRKMMQFYWGKPLKSLNDIEYRTAKEFVERHFVMIKAQEELYNYKDILNMIKKTRGNKGIFQYALIDPYNSLKTDLSGYSKLSTHDYHYEALSEIKAFGQQNQFGFFINNHAVTESLRKLDKEGYPVAPNKADTEGGGKSANKADDFITLHRKTQHPTEWMITEVHIRKIKDTETGGKPTGLNTPVKFRMNVNGCGFTEYQEGLGVDLDPIQQWHFGNQPIQQEINLIQTPYKNEGLENFEGF